MKMFLISAAAMMLSHVAVAAEPFVELATDENGKVSEQFIDERGERHGLGYLGQGSVHGVIHWSPAITRGFPDKFDLRELGLSPPIKNQGSCGSCWAFSITRAHESAMLKQGKDYVDLSEQEMVSCADAYGCNGGYMSNMSYVKDKGQASEADWRYTATTGRCRNPMPPRASQAVKWGYVGASNRKPTLDEVKQALMDFSALSAEVAAGGAFSPNSRGFIDRCSSNSINHMVEIEGWVDESHLILGNSWGTNWGDKGFAYTPLGCNRFGNRVTWVQVEGGPGPQVPNVRLPAEIRVLPGTELMLGVRPEQGVAYAWFANDAQLTFSESMIYVKPTADTVYKIVASTAAGVAESSVLVKVSAE